MSGNISLGHNIESGSPMTVPRSLFGHVHVRGMTGSGKTSLALIPLARELMSPYSHNGATERDPLFVFDLGGDQNFFAHMMREAKRHSRTFRFLTLDPDLDTFFFPPFQAVPPGERNIIRICQMLVQAFHMDHGLVYGGQYYTQQNMGALLRVARKLAEQSQNPSLYDVARYLDDSRNRREFRDADQVRMTFEFLLEYPQLATATTEREIDMLRALENSEIIYFFTPTLTEPMTARLVAGLGLYTLVNAALQRAKRGLPRRIARVLVDEFQELAGRSFAALMAQTRKFGLSLILANQSTSQLENRDIDLADIVFEGSQVKQYFTCVGRRDTEVLQSLSKDKIRTLGSVSENNLSVSHQLRDEVVPTLERDEILDVTSTFGQSFVVLNDGTGHRDPTRVQQSHDYVNLSHVPLPAADGEFPTPRTRVPEPDTPERARRQKLLSTIIAEKEAALRFEEN